MCLGACSWRSWLLNSPESCYWHYIKDRGFNSLADNILNRHLTETRFYSFLTIWFEYLTPGWKRQIKGDRHSRQMLEALLTEFNNCLITRSRKQSVIFTQEWSQEGGKCRFINEQNIINFVGSYFICRSRGGLLANKKEEKFASNDNKPCLYSDTSWKILQNWELAWYGIELLKHARHLGKSEEENMPDFFGQRSPWPLALKILQPALVPLGIWVPGYKQLLNYMHFLCGWLASGFVPVFDQKNQVFFKDIQGHISHFSRTPFSAKKRFESMSFLVLLQHEQFNLKGLSVFIGLDKVSTKIQGLSSTDCNFQGLSRPWISILKFKDFQSVCEPCSLFENLMRN